MVKKRIVFIYFFLFKILIQCSVEQTFDNFLEYYFVVSGNIDGRLIYLKEIIEIFKATSSIPFIFNNFSTDYLLKNYSGLFKMVLELKKVPFASEIYFLKLRKVSFITFVYTLFFNNF